MIELRTPMNSYELLCLSRVFSRIGPLFAVRVNLFLSLPRLPVPPRPH